MAETANRSLVMKNGFRYLTIPLQTLRKEWDVLDEIQIPSGGRPDRVSQLPTDNSSVISDSSSSSSSDRERDQAEITPLRGQLIAILQRKTKKNGRISYIVEWEDGSKSEEGPEVVRRFPDIFEDYEHKRMRSEISDDVGTSDASASEVQNDYELVKRPKIRLRRRVPLEDGSSSSEYEAGEKSDTKEAEIENEQLHLSGRPRRKVGKRVPKEIHIAVEEEQKLPALVSHNVPLYTSNEFIDNHWDGCSKCQNKGNPNWVANGSPHGSRLRDEDSGSYEGRLLLCHLCATATHEGCLPAQKYISKRYFRTYSIEDKEIQAYQCSYCLHAKGTTSENLAKCNGCGKPYDSDSIDASERRIDFPITEDAQVAKLEVTQITRLDKAAHVDKEDVVFRCSRCIRPYHYGCFPSFPDEDERFGNMSEAEKSAERKVLCREQWKCPDCIFYSKPVESVITCRPCDANPSMVRQNYIGTREFLVKWKDTSYRHLSWVPESWLSRVASAKYRNFCERHPDGKGRPVEDILPKEWKMVDRILDVELHNDKRRPADRFKVDNIKQIFAKFQGLPYDEACWDTPPPTDSELYPEFALALERFVRASKITAPSGMKELVQKVKQAATNEEYKNHEVKKQPKFITGGYLMDHQLDGLNWLLYQWERDQPCVLADDMGLGKTIQIVTFLYYLLKRFKIYPFLVVVPNSTAMNWLREFQKWAPDMTVVPFHGSAKSRKLALEKEIFAKEGGANSIRCHAIILTYESALAEASTFAKVNFWPAIVVDEAHRLKNNASQLFLKLKTLRCHHTVLLTGTPLQNNIRELFNIMHFIDPKKFFNVEILEEQYAELSHDLVQQLHEKLKPYFLRRTKKVVLRTLPPKSEIIVPISMTSLQKTVYKEILTKNVSFFATLAGSHGNQSRTNKSLNNVLMQLRKTLNHPYLIQDVEIQQSDPANTHRALIDACEKLKILHQMLPKLKKGGHRLLIFSTMQLTLDILEDYLTFEGFKYVRLDGNTSQLDRVKNIDAFNAPNSDIFVFLLTTRAGGVGINLATADTVIVWDSDFNPHADMQAINRIHRIGQTKPILVLKFMTRFSVEEKIMQLSKKKMVLDHLVVEKMDDKDLESETVESILKYGAQRLFEGDESKDITYDSVMIDELIDRSKIVPEAVDETTEQEETGEKPMSFSFAKVWSHGKDTSTDDNPVEDDEKHEQEGNDFWSRFLKEQQEQQAIARQQAEVLGRGARKRAQIHYNYGVEERRAKKHKGKEKVSPDDEEFIAQQSGSEEETLENEVVVANLVQELTPSEYQQQQHQFPGLTKEQILVNPHLQVAIRGRGRGRGRARARRNSPGQLHDNLNTSAPEQTPGQEGGERGRGRRRGRGKGRGRGAGETLPPAISHNTQKNFDLSSASRPNNPRIENVQQPYALNGMIAPIFQQYLQNFTATTHTHLNTTRPATPPRFHYFQQTGQEHSRSFPVASTSTHPMQMVQSAYSHPLRPPAAFMQPVNLQSTPTTHASQQQISQHAPYQRKFHNTYSALYAAAKQKAAAERESSQQSQQQTRFRSNSVTYTSLNRQPDQYAISGQGMEAAWQLDKSTARPERPEVMQHYSREEAHQTNPFMAGQQCVAQDAQSQHNAASGFTGQIFCLLCENRHEANNCPNVYSVPHILGAFVRLEKLQISEQSRNTFQQKLHTLLRAAEQHAQNQRR